MPDGLWFPSRHDPSSPRPAVSVGNSMSRAMRRAGIPDGHPHQLRAWYATELVRAGVPLTTVRVLMRHSQLSTTQAYVLVGGDECSAAVLRLAA
jgi:integrase/recombinase XerD